MNLAQHLNMDSTILLAIYTFEVCIICYLSGEYLRHEQEKHAFVTVCRLRRDLFCGYCYRATYYCHLSIPSSIVNSSGIFLFPIRDLNLAWNLLVYLYSASSLHLSPLSSIGIFMSALFEL